MRYTTDNRELTELKSVGAWLDTDNIIVYPIQISGAFSPEDGVSLIEEGLNQEWWDTLSKEDKTIIDKAQLIKVDMIGFEGTWKALDAIKL